MATMTIASGAVTTGRVTLIASDVLTVNFADNIAAAGIWTDGTADIWYTTDGTTPAVDQCRSIMAGMLGRIVVTTNNAVTGPLDQVKLLSLGTPVVRVEKA